MFCCGPFDDTLPLFPFCGTIRVILRHPIDPSLNVEGTIDTDDDDDFAALSAVMLAAPSDLHGWDEFCSYEEACDSVDGDGLLRFDFVVRWKKLRSEHRTRKRKNRG